MAGFVLPAGTGSTWVLKDMNHLSEVVELEPRVPSGSRLVPPVGLKRNAAYEVGVVAPGKYSVPVVGFKLVVMLPGHVAVGVELFVIDGSSVVNLPVVSA